MNPAGNFWLEPVAAEIERILPEGPSGLAGSSGYVDLEAGPARFRLFEAVARLLQRNAQRVPLALFFDDIHHWDDASLSLLHFLAHDLHEPPIMVLAAYREAELARTPSHSDLVATIAQTASAMTLSLGGFNEAEVAAFVRRATGRSVGATELRQIVEATGGNPFFLTQLVPLLIRGNHVSDRSFSARLSRSVRGAIERHVASLASRCRGMLRVASVAGREFEADVVATAVPLDRSVFLDTLNEATTAGVLLESRNGQSFRFAHGLLRDVLDGSVSELERARLHSVLGIRPKRASKATKIKEAGSDRAHLDRVH